MKDIPEYNDRIVAFIDILGFSSLVSSLHKDPSLHARIYRALKEIKSSRDSSLRENTAQSNLEVNQFSDSIVITSEPTFDGFFSVLWACGWLHARLLYLGILTRGGISIGPTVHESDFIYGEGMIKAHQIESSAAVYPRIVIDEQVFNQLNLGDKRPYLVKDLDGLWFIDPFEFEASAPGATELSADGYDPREIYFKELSKHIELGLSQAVRVDHKAKWKWLENRHQIAYQYYLSGGKSMFVRALELAEEQQRLHEQSD